MAALPRGGVAKLCCWGMVRGRAGLSPSLLIDYPSTLRNSGANQKRSGRIGALALEEEIRAFLEVIASQNAQAVSWICPGTNDFSAFDAIDNVSLPEELRQLWSSFNGMSVPEGTLLQYTWLDGTFSYLGVEESARDFGMSIALWEQDQDFEAYWPKAFVPIGTPGDGSRLLVNCLAGSPTFGSVYELFHGIGVSRMSASLSQYFKTLNTCQATGALTVTDDGEVSIDFDAFKRIGRQMNPGCDHFD